MFCNFLQQLNMAKRRHIFKLFFVLKLWETKFALACSFQMLAFSGREKIGNSFYFKILDSQLYKL